GADWAAGGACLMARQALRDVIDAVVRRAWEAGAQTAFMQAGLGAPEAHQQVQSDRDPVWRTAREDSLRRQQRLAREDLHRVLESLLVEATRQLTFDKAS